ncbi:TlpA family protein disulfide reductase [Capnocytophaga canimorsus]|uniref:TlpA family protein disulfide reductase n=1 Tax=Capnocytophaga canimorsus TaxID=28188 RepID=UPI000D6E4AAE|nr:TlpA disulfide reductase family protein [Capnocytophaga canimorsus]AWL78974.1 TlpA family protein disulfide reductase [Capnocytophaga canimorsus]AYW37573.1 TlpA family protein disulfide reductase [Capnocytophaga canimorsus]MDT9498972.1 TlpA family protein disulfide reductase [Capnocytophaga canimorsus]
MKKKIILSSCLILLGIPLLRAQLTMSQRIEYSELASPKDKKLFFIDYWATWCAPCITVASYLTTLQEQFRDDLYVISLTQESPDVVKPFLQKHHSKLAVSIDYEGENFKKHKVRALPYGVLLNAQGEVLWKGNPANITANMIRGFLSKNARTVPIYDFLKYSSYTTDNEVDIVLEGDYKLIETNLRKSSFSVIERNKNITLIRGNLSQIFAYLLKINQKQIFIENDDITYEFLIKNNLNSLENEKAIFHLLLKDLKMNMFEKSTSGRVFVVDLPENTSKYWDNNQIGWGEQNSKFLIDDTQFSADDISVFDFIYKLSELSEVPIVLKNSRKSSEQLFDWEVHYKFFDLMKSNLNDFGITVEERTENYPIYIIERI